MSNPPKIIQIKRKRDDDAVTFLQLKRRRSNDSLSKWVYQRRDAVQPPTPVATDHSPNDVRPIIHSSKPRDEPTSQSSAVVPPVPQTSTPRSPSKTLDPAFQLRHFHISRSAKGAATGALLSGGISKKRRYSPIVVIERPRKVSRKPSRDILTAKTVVGYDGRTGRDGEKDKVAERPLKKPAGSRQSKASRGTSQRAQPPSMMNRHNEDLDKITADMNDWAMEQIRLNIEDMEQTRRRYLPKAPTQRIFDRQPELFRKNQDDEMMANESDTDSDDYVNDDYVLVPASTMGTSVDPRIVGVLDLDDEQDQQYFYGPESDSDDNLPEDEEDENAENHYTADYPDEEEESESEDGYGGSHGYRNGYGPNDDEYDLQHDENDGYVLDDGDDDDEYGLREARHRFRQYRSYN